MLASQKASVLSERLSSIGNKSDPVHKRFSMFANNYGVRLGSMDRQVMVALAEVGEKRGYHAVTFEVIGDEVGINSNMLSESLYRIGQWVDLHYQNTGQAAPIRRESVAAYHPGIRGQFLSQLMGMKRAKLNAAFPQLSDSTLAELYHVLNKK